jgi:peptidylprolyl isomerase
MKRVARYGPLAVAGLGLLLFTGCGGENKLEIKDLQEGAGPAAQRDDLIEVHYTGWLRDGTQFDTSRDSSRPFRFFLGQRKVIAGWDKGLLGMKMGGRRELLIPAKLAYGEQGSPPTIPPNAELKFEVELLAVYRVVSEGLYVCDLKEGKGEPIKKGSRIEIAYRAWGPNGRPIGQAAKTPLELELGSPQVIQGFNEGLEGMKVGGQRKLIVPQSLVLRKEGPQPSLPPDLPGGELTFEVELVKAK